MRVFGIDTATAVASVGLWADGAVLYEQQTSSRNHAASLLPLIEAVLLESRIALSEIQLIAVSAGPGSFSGLRVGLSVGKGIAFAAGVDLVAVSTLEALAASVADHDGFICSLLDAHKGEVYLGRFESRAGELHRLAPDSVVTPEVAASLLPKRCVIIGNAAQRYEAVLLSRQDVEVTILAFPEFGPRGGKVAELAARQFERSGPQPAASLEPFYVRAPDVHVSA